VSSQVKAITWLKVGELDEFARCKRPRWTEVDLRVLDEGGRVGLLELGTTEEAVQADIVPVREM
jgi:hypothetical protein